MGNAELNHLVSILNLDYKKTYETPEELSTLRYGKLMLMCDQDHDGSHIKGLFINLLHVFWPSLLKHNTFLEEFVTPIVKATRGKREHSFFTLPEFEAWNSTQSEHWNVKYYKGLGTSTSAEAKKYFSELDQHRIGFDWLDDRDGEAIEMAFGAQAQPRKNWLMNLQEGTFLDQSTSRVSYQDFVNKELILFSMADNVRSLPSVMDGLKPGQRKVLHACFRRRLTKEIKVAQLSGYVSEHTGYHHGEASLHGTIINMAQDFLGSNNVPLLEPRGQFGTRHMGGQDASSPRYIFTRLDPLARLMFPEADDAVLTMNVDDGQTVEPVFFAPIVPVVLVNGSHGIGTGWSTDVPAHSPLEVVDAMLLALDGKEIPHLLPWYNGFRGVVREGKKSAESVGVARITEQDEVLPLDSKKKKPCGPLALITELPATRWTSTYKQQLDVMRDAEEPLIAGYRDESTDSSVRLVVEMTDAGMREIEHRGIESALKLISTHATTNLHCFNAQGQITHYASAEEIIEAFIPPRRELYSLRKNHLVEKLSAEVARLGAKLRFVEAVACGDLVIGGKPKAEVVASLVDAGFDQDGVDDLMGMPLWSITKERLDTLRMRTVEKKTELERLQGMTVDGMWREDLMGLRNALVARGMDEPRRE